MNTSSLFFSFQFFYLIFFYSVNIIICFMRILCCQKKHLFQNWIQIFTIIYFKSHKISFHVTCSIIICSLSVNDTRMVQIAISKITTSSIQTTIYFYSNFICLGNVCYVIQIRITIALCKWIQIYFLFTRIAKY